MIRGTTPDYILTLAAYDLTGKRVYVTIKQRGREFTKSNEDVEITVDTSGQTPVSTIALTLTQQETLGLVEGPASVQLKMIDSEGHVDATGIGTLDVGKALLERVISYDSADSTP